jgi:hypothetical protein
MVEGRRTEQDYAILQPKYILRGDRGSGCGRKNVWESRYLGNNDGKLYLNRNQIP